jgi:isoleucyl-tRNA synthetase
MSDKTGDKFPEYGSDYSFPSFEERVLAYWNKQKTFEKSLEEGKGRPEYFFYDGPPFATGLPHYGHILAGTIKDIVPRYWTMRGYTVPRRFGWDTHGLPVEFEMEKTLGLSGSLDIQDYGVAKFNEACRGIVLRYTGEWRKTVERMGRWIDMDHDYKTMDPSFMESVWWVFKELWNKGLIYEGKKVVPYSWRLTAPLSNFEASLNYKDVQDPAITVLMPLTSLPPQKDPRRAAAWLGNTALAVWTTTPWTLPSNLAVAVNSDPAKVMYGRYKLPQAMGAITHVVVAETMAESFKLSERDCEVLGEDLIGANYEPLFSCYDDEDRRKDNAFRVIPSDHVSATDGTGLVHMAPSFGEDDYYACQRAGIGPVDPTDMQANFTEAVAKDERLKPIVGQFVKDADKHIIRMLKESGRLMKQDTLQHAYPFCERSDTPLIYKAISSWFVKVEDVKDKMLKNNEQIRWVPEHIKEGRFGKWLENARDWCISRNRFWGTPIPVWRCERCAHREVVGSRAELDKLAGRHVEDLHKHFVDEIMPDCPKCGAKSALKRTPEVLDCWFESGSMPYAQNHYPFEHRKEFDESFPADFIAEGLDQTRGWFYTLTVLSTALFNKPAFKNCIVNGMVLAEDGKKMSKRLKNYPAPSEIFDKYGADALRLYLMQSPAMHAEELRFSEKGLLELMRAVMLPLWNAYGFFASYANIDAWTPEKVRSAAEAKQGSLTLLDTWILARAKETQKAVHAHMEQYHLSDVAPTLIGFIDDLTNWYIRLNRERYWKENDPASQADKSAAYGTLFSALQSLSRTLAPFLPFLAEVMNSALHGRNVSSLHGEMRSVHLDLFADPKSLELKPRELEVLECVRVAKNIILLGRSLRGEAKIGLRQPLPKLRVAGLSASETQALVPLHDLVCRELNVKALELVSKASDLVEESAKPNHRVLGKKVGGAMKDVQAQLSKWGSQEISNFEKSGKAQVSAFTLTPEDVQIVRKAKAGHFAQAGFGLVAELDTSISDELLREGLQREIINRVQQMRKERKLHLADRIRIVWNATPGSLVEKTLLSESQSSGLVASETLAIEVKKIPSVKEGMPLEDFGEHGKFHFDIEKI